MNKFIISYETFYPTKGCNIRVAFVCNGNMIDKRLTKLVGVSGFVVKAKVKGE